MRLAVLQWVGSPFVLLLLLLFLAVVSRQLSPPFRYDGLAFNSSAQIQDGAKVTLRCEYLPMPLPVLNMRMIISFVPEYRLTKSEAAVAASTQFLFPRALKELHKSYGRIINERIFESSTKNLTKNVITTSFFMSAEHAGSYICQISRTGLPSKREFELTRWMLLGLRPPSLLPHIGLVSMVVVMACSLLCCAFMVWYRTIRLQAVVFKRVIIRHSPLYTSGAPGEVVDYQPPEVSLVPEPQSLLRTCRKLFYGQRGCDRFSDVETSKEETAASTVSGTTISATGPNPACDKTGEANTESQNLPSCHGTGTVGRRVQFLIPFDANFEIGPQSLLIEQRLDSGAFGVVFRGSAVNLPGGVKGPLAVAIKTLRDESTEEDVVAFVQEMELMKFIGKHENVIQLYATSTRKGRPMMILEYAEEGSLVNYLRGRRTVLATQTGSKTESVLLRFAVQVARGMAYLASRGIVHRDLAARNVLLAKNLVAKVADFGLTRRAEFYYRMRRPGRVPLKWMAPESIFQKIFTTKSDVWSFGVLLWELFSLGEQPAGDLPTNKFIRALVEGSAVYSKPEYASEELFTVLMLRCWKRQPTYRPTFGEILNILSEYSERY